jgi:flagellar FlgN protein
VSHAAAAALAAELDEAVACQERLLALVQRQRPEIVAGRHGAVDAIAGEIEVEVRRLAGIERGRQAAAEALADALGLAATRWSALEAALEPADRDLLAPRVARLESTVRDLELANAINGQLVRQELELVDLSVRSLGAPDPRTSPRAYTAGGARAGAGASGPVLLNTAA